MYETCLTTKCVNYMLKAFVIRFPQIWSSYGAVLQRIKMFWTGASNKHILDYRGLLFNFSVIFQSYVIYWCWFRITIHLLLCNIVPPVRSHPLCIIVCSGCAARTASHKWFRLGWLPNPGNKKITLIGEFVFVLVRRNSDIVL